MKIFLSYSREDEEVAGRAAELLGQRHEVFWDLRIAPGQRWDQRIERELAAADRVVVLWSRSSIGREWVRVEAAEAGDRLVPVRLEDVQQPLAFRLRQTLDLLDWQGDPDHPGFVRLLEVLEEPVVSSSSLQKVYQVLAPSTRRRAATRVGQVAALGLAAFVPWWLDLVPVSDTSLRFLPPVLAVATAVLLLTLGLAVVRFLAWHRRVWLWRALALVAAAIALWVLPGYGRHFSAGTVEVPIGEDLELQRRVVGSEYTPRVQRFLEVRPEAGEDRASLIRDAGGIERVWTAESIEAQWQALLLRFVVGVGAALLAALALLRSLEIGSRRL